MNLHYIPIVIDHRYTQQKLNVASFGTTVIINI